jgi:phosphatidylglycerophosphatase A
MKLLQTLIGFGQTHVNVHLSTFQQLQQIKLANSALLKPNIVLYAILIALIQLLHLIVINVNLDTN